MNRKTKAVISFLVSAIVLTFFLFSQISLARNESLRVYFFDVGQGDSILIRTPDARDVLIDGGPDNKVLERLSEVMPFWDRNIDMVVLTHPHDDHIAGLDEVLKRFKIGEILEPDLKNIPDNEKYFDTLATSNGVKEEKALKGDIFDLGSGISLKIIYPLVLQEDEDNLNDDSVVIQMSYKGKKFLFTGDATENVEAKILDQDLDSNFLKVGHHGSRYSSSQKFLEAVSPSVSIISVGEGNTFGHPTQDTLDRLSSIGSKVLRTDENGTVEVEVESDGQWEIKCSKSCD